MCVCARARARVYVRVCVLKRSTKRKELEGVVGAADTTIHVLILRMNEHGSWFNPDLCYFILFKSERMMKSLMRRSHK